MKPLEQIFTHNTGEAVMTERGRAQLLRIRKSYASYDNSKTQSGGEIFRHKSDRIQRLKSQWRANGHER